MGGYHIPRNTIVMANFWAVHHDPKLVGRSGHIQTGAISVTGRIISCEVRQLYAFLHRYIALKINLGVYFFFNNLLFLSFFITCFYLTRFVYFFKLTLTIHSYVKPMVMQYAA